MGVIQKHWARGTGGSLAASRCEGGLRPGVVSEVIQDEQTHLAVVIQSLPPMPPHHSSQCWGKPEGRQPGLVAPQLSWASGLTLSSAWLLASRPKCLYVRAALPELSSGPWTLQL